MSSRGPKSLPELIRAIEAEGGRVERPPGHLRVVAPDGRSCRMASTPSNGRRAILNAVAYIRRELGFDLRGDQRRKEAHRGKARAGHTHQR